jgi:hypothetical protein
MASQEWRTGLCEECGEPCSNTARRCHPCFARNHGTTLPLSGRERAAVGCLMTFEAADGSRLTLHGFGSAAATVGALCDAALAREPSFRLIAYSTPETVFADITGGRADFTHSSGEPQRRALPEMRALALACRKEMLHPRLAASAPTLPPRAESTTRKRRRSAR